MNSPFRFPETIYQRNAVAGQYWKGDAESCEKTDSKYLVLKGLGKQRHLLWPICGLDCCLTSRPVCQRFSRFPNSISATVRDESRWLIG